MRIFVIGRLTTAIVLAFAMAALLAGCGQKGDLYLPPEQTASIAPAAQTP